MSTNRFSLDATLLFLVALATGCSSFTNPVANGIPARLVPDELLVEDRSQKETIPMTWLRRKPEADYKLAPGDILGVYIVGVLGEEDQLPPVLSADVADRPPSVGFPIPLRLNGTIPLPYIDPVEVEGLTVEQAQAKILKAYTADTEILKPGEASILVTLASPRQAQILVIREDSQVQGFGGGGGIGGFASIPQRGSGTGSVVELPATKADVLEVLTRSGGLPQGNSADEVIIQRGYAGENRWPLDSDGNYCAMPVSDGSDDGDQASGRPQFTRIPLRLRPGTQPPFKPADVMLEDGDIVVVPAGELQVYYTGGLLFSREIPLPQDESLRAIEAVLRAQGPFLNGGIVLNFGGGASSLRGLGNPSPSLLTVLRHTEDGHQFPIRVDLNRAARDARENLIVGPGDVLVLQETPQEAFARYVSQMFSYSFLGRVPNRQDATGVISGNVP